MRKRKATRAKRTEETKRVRIRRADGKVPTEESQEYVFCAMM